MFVRENDFDPRSWPQSATVWLPPQERVVGHDQSIRTFRWLCLVFLNTILFKCIYQTYTQHPYYNYFTSCINHELGADVTRKPRHRKLWFSYPETSWITQLIRARTGTPFALICFSQGSRMKRLYPLHSAEAHQIPAVPTCPRNSRPVSVPSPCPIQKQIAFTCGDAKMLRSQGWVGERIEFSDPLDTGCHGLWVIV